MRLKKIDDYRWEIPRSGAMRVPGLIFSSEKMIGQVIADKAVEQVANVAALPGIVGQSLAMPDIHQGYGFCIGGVAAFDRAEGVISPGGIGYDINCGVRLLTTRLHHRDIAKKLPDLLEQLFIQVPSGVGSSGKLALTRAEMRDVLCSGAAWAVDKGFGNSPDLLHSEEEGVLDGADPDRVSDRAVERGSTQIGTLGAGNHFLEVQVIDGICDSAIAEAFGLHEGFVTVMIHTGSRGLGYQVCDDYIRLMQAAAKKFGIELPDRQLACAPIDSAPGKQYYAAMAAAANYAWANRQVITHRVREVFSAVLGCQLRAIGLDVLYDVAHNIGKFEEHGGRNVFVHRKGATRAFPKGHAAVPADYRSTGQPVLVPGTMGTASYILCGTGKALAETWGSACHGAGRVMSRTQALKQGRGQNVAAVLEKRGIAVKADSWKTLAEEAPAAYKEIDGVVDVCQGSGMAVKVARLKPIAVIKG